VALFQWEPRGATLTVRALAEVTVGAVSAILIAAMPTVQNIDLLVVVGAGATAVWSPLLFYPQSARGSSTAFCDVCTGSWSGAR
jgi:hypothetical protein